MDPELRDLAEQFGDDELVDRVERLEDELDEVLADLHDEMEEEEELDRLLREEADFSDEGIDGMPLEAKRDVVDELGIGEERSNAKVNVAGQPEKIPDESPDVAVNRSSPETYEKEVEVPVAGGDDDPDTMTVEYEESGPTVEAINEYQQWLAEARSEATKEREERQEEQDEGYMPTGVVNLNEVDEIDEEDSDVPVAGKIDREEDDE